MAEITALVEFVSEVLNGVGRMSLLISRHDDKATEAFLRFGNRVLVQFNNGLPTWGGVIEPPEKWTQQLIQVTVYSAEKLLDFHMTDKGRYFSGETIGTMFTRLIQEANGLGVEVGEVWGGGTSHSPAYHLETILTIIQKSLLGRLSSADFAVTASEVKGRIVLKANLYKRRGTYQVNAALVGGANVTQADLLRQGPIVNEWTIAGADISGQGANGWGDGRLISTKRNEASIQQYGLRQAGAVFNDIVLQPTLDNKAQALLEETAWPRNIYDVTVADVEPGRFASYGVGDSLRLVLPHYGWDGTDTTVRVVGREFMPRTGTATLIVQEV